MNIAMICDPVMYQSGGSDVSTVRFAELLKKKGHNVIFIAAKRENSKKIDYYNNIKVYGFNAVRMPLSQNKFHVIFPSAKSLKKIFVDEKIDVVHVMQPLPSALSAIKAGRELKLKIVTHAHARPENVFWSFVPKHLRNRKMIDYLYKSMLSVYKKSDITISPTKLGARDLHHYEPNLKIAVITNGVDKNKFKKINSISLRKKYGFSLNDKLILYVGRLHPEKSVETLIKAMPQILKKERNAHLLIAGEGYLKSTLERLAKKMKVSENVNFLGNVDNKKISEVYNIADLFVLPSVIEIEGMVVMEAMACAKPILIADSKYSAASQFVNGNGYLFKTKNPADLAAKALNILSDKKLRQTMGQKSLELSKQYDINKSVKLLEKIYAKKTKPL
jgi:1,2-diacylglycerol 3-alpha-glucosyltransferase